MCILFVYRGDDDDSDYKLIVASNRDEHYQRPAAYAAVWEEDPDIIGGRDMETGREGGTWLALSPARARLAVLLNLSGSPKPNARGRGNIVADYVKCDMSTEDYIKKLEPGIELYNDFNLVTVEIGKTTSKLYSYSNFGKNLVEMGNKSCQGFGNSLPENPLKKVSAGTERFQEICKEWGRTATRDVLVEKLIGLLKWDERHLPDAELQRRCPLWYEALSSVFVRMPDQTYGTRTHTLVLMKRDGSAEFLELSLEQPADPAGAWHKTDLNCQVHL